MEPMMHCQPRMDGVQEALFNGVLNTRPWFGPNARSARTKSRRNRDSAMAVVRHCDRTPALSAALSVVQKPRPVSAAAMNCRHA
jgi:hypothetical protein